MNKENAVVITIRDGKRPTYRYRRDLAEMGFRYDTGKAAWNLRERVTKDEENNLRIFCRKRKLRIEITGESLARDGAYRKRFFENYGRETYLCAYCGRRLSRAAVTVDHIIPVGQLKNKKRSMRLAILRINNINDTKNLAPACARCNKKKGAKTGLWVVRGFWGKNYRRRLIMNWIRNILIICLLIILFTGIARCFGNI